MRLTQPGPVVARPGRLREGEGLGKAARAHDEGCAAGSHLARPAGGRRRPDRLACWRREAAYFLQPEHLISYTAAGPIDQLLIFLEAARHPL